MKHLEKRDLFGIPPRETPEGIFPSPTLPTPKPAPRVVEAAPAQTRRVPIATRDAPAAVTIVTPIELHDENEKS